MHDETIAKLTEQAAGLRALPDANHDEGLAAIDLLTAAENLKRANAKRAAAAPATVAPTTAN